jgi:hypothetical protein
MTARIQLDTMRAAILVLLALNVVQALKAADPYTPLWLYSGSWRVTHKDQSSEKLTNQCALVGRFFTCEQTVNSVHGNLLIFIPVPDKPGHYYTQNVRPEGRASSRGDLEIQGDRWIYTSTWDQGGSTVYYRNTNIFTGRNKINYEQAESTDNKNWTVKNSGEEVRVSGSGR